MSLARTKEQLIKLLGQADNSVIALSGKWGTGKTHLWNEVKSSSNDDKVKKALYVSLFGLSSIDQVKRKLIETAIPGVESHGGMFDGLKNLLRLGVKVGSEHYKALAAINDLNMLLMAPVVLSNGVIVIDDIERKHEKLGIDEVLGSWSRRQPFFPRKLACLIPSSQHSLSPRSRRCREGHRLAMRSSMVGSKNSKRPIQPR